MNMKVLDNKINSVIMGYDLPNMLVTDTMANKIYSGKSTRYFGEVSEPLPGKYSNRFGKKLQRNELYRLVDIWVDSSRGQSRFVIQGGNRYISRHISNKGLNVSDIKLSSIDKSPLYHHLCTLISSKELVKRIQIFQDGKTISGSRFELLKLYAENIISSPFSRLTKDENLDTELGEAVKLISSNNIKIPNLKILQQIVRDTKLAKEFSSNKEMHFIDDLFYRGRTLYSLAVLIILCGGKTNKLHLTTIGCDQESSGLITPYHIVMRPGLLYPFENSVRTEQGYWQDIGDRYLFTDMGAYLEHLRFNMQNTHVYNSNIYTEFKNQVILWGKNSICKGSDESLMFSLAWLIIYSDIYKLEINKEKIIDQKGYKIGACAPFVELLDRFISQEETVGARLQFKNLVSRQLDSLILLKNIESNTYRQIRSQYRKYYRDIDYYSLIRMFNV